MSSALGCRYPLKSRARAERGLLVKNQLVNTKHLAAVNTLRFSALALIGSCMLMVGCVQGAYAYRFLDSNGPRFPILEPQVKWDPDIWGPEDVLSLVLVDNPEWESLSPDILEVKRLVEEALAAWASVSSADVRWQVGEIAPHIEGGIPIGNTISVSGGGISTTWIQLGRGGDGLYYIDGIQVFMSPGSVESRDRFERTLIHELGHVLGLDHAGVYMPDIQQTLVARPRYWWVDPIMSGGYRSPPGTGSSGANYQRLLTLDDRVGVSLIRPRERWAASTGNIRGTVLVNGSEGAVHVHVLATRMRLDGTMVGSVGAITNVRGEFAIGGLDPGRYVLLIRSLIVLRAHLDLLRWGTTNIRDTLWTDPITVEAGPAAVPVNISVQPETAQIVQ